MKRTTKGRNLYLFKQVHKQIKDINRHAVLLPTKTSRRKSKKQTCSPHTKVNKQKKGEKAAKNLRWKKKREREREREKRLREINTGCYSRGVMHSKRNTYKKRVAGLEISSAPKKKNMKWQHTKKTDKCLETVKDVFFCTAM